MSFLYVVSIFLSVALSFCLYVYMHNIYININIYIYIVIHRRVCIYIYIHMYVYVALSPSSARAPYQTQQRPLIKHLQNRGWAHTPDPFKEASGPYRGPLRNFLDYSKAQHTPNMAYCSP